MKSSFAGILVPAAVAVMGTIVVVFWVGTGAGVPVEMRVSDMDGAPPIPVTRSAGRPVPGEPVLGEGRPAKLKGAWPWFRGPDLDAINKETVTLARKWPAAGPKRLWSVTLGKGCAAAAVRGGCVYVLDHAHDVPIDLLRRLTDEERAGLADVLATVSPGDMTRADPVLGRLFPVRAADAAGRRLVTQTQYDALRQALQQRLLHQRDLLLQALRKNTLDDIDYSADTMRCLSLDDGREIWHNSYPVVLADSHGMSRTIPAVVDGNVLSLGPRCHVVCWDAEGGTARWLIDLVLDHGATVPKWYAGQCPLVDAKTERLIVAPGGKALVMAIDYRSGKVVWQSPNPRGWTMTHVSIVPMEFAGRRMYVYCGKGGVAGVAADTGELLWDTPDWKIDMATCPTPVVVGEGKIFFCGGYTAGSLMLQLTLEQGRIVPHTLFRLTFQQFSSEQQTPVFWQGHLYGVRKDEKLVCIDLEGKELWNSGSDKFGLAPYMIADGLILAMNNEGVLTMAEANSTAYKRLGRAQVIENGDSSWGPMALVKGRLIVRDFTRMVCLDLAEH